MPKNNILPFARYEASIHSISDIVLSEKKTKKKQKKQTSINNDLFFVSKRKNVPNNVCEPKLFVFLYFCYYISELSIKISAFLKNLGVIGQDIDVTLKCANLSPVRCLRASHITQGN